jgi:hypothetical protein
MACRARSALLARQQQQAADREAFGRAWQDIGLVFTTRSGLPVEPRNLVRSFRRPPLVLLQHFRGNVRLISSRQTGAGKKRVTRGKRA